MQNTQQTIQHSVAVLTGLLVLATSTPAIAQIVYTPAGMVNEQGQLVIGDQTIDPPLGTADGSGNLVLPSGTITKPITSVLADGSLMADGYNYPVPGWWPPISLLTWLGEGTIPIPWDYTPGEPLWLFSYNYKSFYHFGDAAYNWIWMERFGGAYLAIAMDSGSAASGFWAYSFGFPVAGVNAWIWIFRNDSDTPGKSFRDLRLEPENPEFPGSVSRRRMTGYIYSSVGQKYYFYTENGAQTAAFVAELPGGSFQQIWP
jgi:hypothetical protein